MTNVTFLATLLTLVISVVGMYAIADGFMLAVAVVLCLSLRLLSCLSSRHFFGFLQVSSADLVRDGCKCYDIALEKISVATTEEICVKISITLFCRREESIGEMARHFRDRYGDRCVIEKFFIVRGVYTINKYRMIMHIPMYIKPEYAFLWIFASFLAVFWLRLFYFL